MTGKAEQRYGIQQGQSLDNATQMGQDGLSILTGYVTPSAVIVLLCPDWLCSCGCYSFATVSLGTVFPTRQGVFVFSLNMQDSVGDGCL